MRAYILLLLAFAASCESGSEKTSQPKFVIDSFFTPPGHERLTRLGIIDANAAIGHDYYHVPDDDDASCQESTKGSLIEGNCQTDTGEGYIGHIYNSNGSFTDWQARDDLNPLHALRVTEDAALLNSNVASCEKIRETIADRTQRAIDAKNAGYVAWDDVIADGEHMALVLIGSATHTIQDGFSKAHVLRDADDFSNLIQICTYGEEFPGICYHSKIAHQDLVDLDSIEAITAIQATSDYLVVAHKALEGQSYSLAPFLDKYFNCR